MVMRMMKMMMMMMMMMEDGETMIMKMTVVKTHNYTEDDGGDDHEIDVTSDSADERP